MSFIFGPHVTHLVYKETDPGTKTESKTAPQSVLQQASILFQTAFLHGRRIASGMVKNHTFDF